MGEVIMTQALCFRKDFFGAVVKQRKRTKVIITRLPRLLEHLMSGRLDPIGLTATHWGLPDFQTDEIRKHTLETLMV